ncbi:MAG TPA: hypothetical protein VE997_07460 [Candidatus Limnocylindria bacterium]|jgi:hypothetical protein|nr:hypothetical protein [Candidatus Limnocylindria bacterium]
MAALAVAGCGSSAFPNEPREAAPIEATASLGPRAVKVSPREFGAGLVNFTIANQTSNPATFRLSGPTSARSAEIPPQAPTTLTANLKTGTYRASAGGDRGLPSTTFKVGPERRSSQNKLLLP